LLLLPGNQLQQVPDSLTELVQLQDLNLSGNFLQELPAGMSALTALTMLSLHGNQLQQLPQQGWQQLACLKEVTLQGNCLTQLPDSFAQLRVGAVMSVGCSCCFCHIAMAGSCVSDFGKELPRPLLHRSWWYLSAASAVLTWAC
jgi:hypothetical protein